MVHGHDRDKFRYLLRKESNRLFSDRNEWKDSWKRLQEQKPELEEKAQKELISRDLEGLDEQGLTAIESIDRALRKLETGSYGVCELCGEMIPDGRLEAIP